MSRFSSPQTPLTQLTLDQTYVPQHPVLALLTRPRRDTAKPSIFQHTEPKYDPQVRRDTAKPSIFQQTEPNYDPNTGPDTSPDTSSDSDTSPEQMERFKDIWTSGEIVQVRTERDDMFGHVEVKTQSGVVYVFTDNPMTVESMSVALGSELQTGSGWVRVEKETSAETVAKIIGVLEDA